MKYMQEKKYLIKYWNIQECINLFYTCLFQECGNMCDMFKTRYDLHEKAYKHRAGDNIETMYVDLKNQFEKTMPLKF